MMYIRGPILIWIMMILIGSRSDWKLFIILLNIMLILMGMRGQILLLAIVGPRAPRWSRGSFKNSARWRWCWVTIV